MELYPHWHLAVHVALVCFCQDLVHKARDVRCGCGKLWGVVDHHAELCHGGVICSWRRVAVLSSILALFWLFHISFLELVHIVLHPYMPSITVLEAEGPVASLHGAKHASGAGVQGDGCFVTRLGLVVLAIGLDDVGEGEDVLGAREHERFLVLKAGGVNLCAVAGEDE